MRVVITFLRRPMFKGGKWYKYGKLPAKVIRRGFRALIYLDDLLFLLQPNKLARRRLALLQELLSNFGLAINNEKSDWTLRGVREHLGLVIDLKRREFRVSPAKLSKLRALARDVITYAAGHKRYVSKRQLASLAGYAISLSPAMPTGRFNLLPLYDAVAQVGSWHRTAMVRLSNTAYRRLKYFWTRVGLDDCHHSWDEVAYDELMFTDASDWGYGAHLSRAAHDALVTGQFSASEAGKHITFKELKVV